MRKQRGFTLVELLVVIAIIGILSAIVLASMSGARSKGRDAKRVADLKQLQLALQLYYDGNDNYPQLSGDVGAAVTGGTVLRTLTTGTNNYISTLPSDPLSSSEYAYLALPSACTGPACIDYVLTAQLESTIAGLDPYTTYQAVTLNGASTNCDQFDEDRVYCVKP